jgi:hypothetical protein
MNMPERWPVPSMPQEDEGRLILIGYWLGPYAPGWPDVRDLVDPTWDPDERDAVIAHLHGATFIHPYLGSHAVGCVVA